MNSKEPCKSELQEEFKERMDYNELLNCMRCGFCLPSCPTYVETNRNEAASPRGRIALIKGVVDGLIEPDSQFENQLNQCLGCRACEPVCPSGVRYGHLLEEARDIIEQKKTRSIIVRFIRWLTFKQLFPYKSRLIKLNGLIWFYQKSGLQKLVRKSGFLSILPTSLRQMEKILPDIPAPKEMKHRERYLKSETSRKKTVAFFSGCLMDTMFLNTNQSTLRLLQKVGCDIIIPDLQVCCGALHGHSGEKEQAKQLAKKNIQAFEKLEVDWIVVNAGGCGGYLVDYGHLLKDNQDFAERAKKFAGKVKDISEVLVELDFHKMDLQLSNQVVTYQDSCHLRNVMNSSAAPRTLLKSIKGLSYKELKESDRCCGSAGIYNLVQEEMSLSILDHKMKHVKDIQPQVIVTANPGCLLQMKVGIEREGLRHKIKAVHISDLLLESTKSSLGDHF
ncbi:(Fe-S)-binding protein [Bacillus salitolerans]|uniref:Glycolate oxidase iron-sulfur subunit n=1 Tax=Bacillus salitolerans TaxID=1437434 RepID=A0ABW4LR46_9BACI